MQSSSVAPAPLLRSFRLRAPRSGPRPALIGALLILDALAIGLLQSDAAAPIMLPWPPDTTVGEPLVVTPTETMARPIRVPLDPVYVEDSNTAWPADVAIASWTSTGTTGTFTESGGGAAGQDATGPDYTSVNVAWSDGGTVAPAADSASVGTAETSAATPAGEVTPTLGSAPDTRPAR
jgi:hypothetical protein